jgi:hypothetical protein
MHATTTSTRNSRGTSTPGRICPRQEKGTQ